MRFPPTRFRGIKTFMPDSESTSENARSLPEGSPGHWILVGPMGSGKSAIAREIGKITDRPVFDTDAWIRLHQGCEISEIIAKHGEAFFRTCETEALKHLAEIPASIVATGGGIVLSSEHRKQLLELGWIVWLDAEESVLFSRVSRNQQRPLLQTDSPRESLHRLVVERLPMYQETADSTIDTSHGTFRTIAEAACGEFMRFSARH